MRVVLLALFHPLKQEKDVFIGTASVATPWNDDDAALRADDSSLRADV